MADSSYLVWSCEHHGWWKPGGWGYSPHVREAARMTRSDALAICAAAVPGSRFARVGGGAFNEIPVRLEDVGDFVAASGFGAAPREE